jgi:uncharacterized protein YbjT (DUF2867 family)
MNPSSQKPILVTGASGRTGLAVIRALLRRGALVRAFVRRAEAKAMLESIGVTDTVIGDLDDEASLRRAIEGTSQVLHICPPMHPQEDELAARMIGLTRDLGVERFVLYSVLHPHIHVPHHERKQIAEGVLIESGLPFTILQPARYMQHLTPIWKNVVATGVHRMPFSTHTRFSLVDLADLAEATALVLTQDGHAFGTYELSGPVALSMADCAAIIGHVLGRTILAEAKPLSQAVSDAEAAGWPPARVENMRIMNAHYDVHGLEGNPNVLRWLLQRPPSTFENFIRRDLAGA